MKSKLILTLTIIGILIWGALLTLYRGEAVRASETPFIVTTLKEPQAVSSDSKTLLVYELNIFNGDRDDNPQILRVDISDAKNNGVRYASYEGDELAKNTLAYYKDGDKIGKSKELDFTLKKGNGMLVYGWVEIDKNQPVPDSLQNRITFLMNGSETTFDYPVKVNKTPPLVISPPLKGDHWVCAFAPGPYTGHRRAAIPIGGKFYLSQRYAIDFVIVNDDNKFAVGDLTLNGSSLCYGKEIMAVADGTITSMSDGMPDSTPPGQTPSNITIENLDGNHVVQDIGGGNYVLYAHILPGSVRVKTGDHVKKGQALGLIGSSGNSDGPHLHFHVCNGPDPIKSEGVPYLFDSFTLRGKTLDDGDMTTGVMNWERLPSPKKVTGIIPVNGQIVKFSDSE